MKKYDVTLRGHYEKTISVYAENVCTRTSAKIKSYQALNLANQIRLLGAAPNTP